MKITLCNSSSEKKVIGKTLSSGEDLIGNLREESNVVRPSILIEHENPTVYNYAYIEEFERYYFIDDFVSVRANLWIITLDCDVLESFKSDILSLNAIIRDTEETGITEYMDGDQWKTLVKTKTDIINFSNGLLESGEYILITAGG